MSRLVAARGGEISMMEFTEEESLDLIETEMETKEIHELVLGSIRSVLSRRGTLLASMELGVRSVSYKMVTLVRSELTKDSQFKDIDD